MDCIFKVTPVWVTVIDPFSTLLKFKFNKCIQRVLIVLSFA